MTEFVEFILFQNNPDIRGGDDRHLPPELFSECVGLWPEFKERGKTGFSVRLPRDSDKLHTILAHLEKNGYSASWDRFSADRESDPSIIRLGGTREFDEDDFSLCNHFVCVPEGMISKDGGRNDDYSISLKRSSIYNKEIGRSLGSSTTLCGSEVREKLKIEEFKGLTFRDVSISGKKQDVSISQLWSDICLPRVLNKVFEYSKKFKHGESKGLYFDDIFYPTIPCFPAGEFKKLGSFDVAITQEHLGAGKARDPLFLVSRRVKDFFDICGYRMSYTPIKLNESPNK